MHSTLESLALSLELLAACTHSVKVGLLRDCLGFCSRLELILESTVKTTSTTSTTSTSSRGGTGSGSGGPWLGVIPGVGALLALLHRLDTQLTPELKGLTAGSKMGGGNVKAVKSRIAGSRSSGSGSSSSSSGEGEERRRTTVGEDTAHGGVYFALSLAKEALGTARLSELLDSRTPTMSHLAPTRPPSSPRQRPPSALLRSCCC